MPFWGTFTSTFGSGIRRSNFGELPSNTIAPEITGTEQQSQTLTSSTGTWDGVPSPTFTYQWYNQVGIISGATSSTYTPTGDDVGDTLRCQVTATNTKGSVSEFTAFTGPIAAFVYSSISWSTITRPSTEFPKDVVVIDETMMLAPGDSGPDDTIWTSTGGNFGAVVLPSPSTSQPVRHISRRNSDGRLVAIGFQGTASWTSIDDGSTWTAHDITLTTPPGYPLGGGSGLMCVNGIYKLITGAGSNPPTASYSSDGITWTTATITGDNTQNQSSVNDAAEGYGQTQAVVPSSSLSNRYWYSDGTTADDEVIIQTPSPFVQVGNTGISGAAWASDIGFMLQVRAGSQFLISTNADGFNNNSTKVTTGSNGGGEGIVALDTVDIGGSSIVLVSPWTATDVWRVNFDLANGGSWTNTTLPASFVGLGLMWAAAGKFYVVEWNTVNIYVGTPQ